MSTGFKFNGTDLDDLLEPYFGSSPNPDFTGYTANGTSLAGRYSGSTRTWEKTMTGGGYYYLGTPIPACLKGFQPSITTPFYAIAGGAGGATRNIYLSRSDSYLSLSGDVSVSFGRNSFRNNTVPMCIGILFCGGGGGGDDNGSGKGDDSWGGGGGGMALCVLSFEGLNETTCLRLGNGGSVGAAGGASALMIGGLNIVTAGGGDNGSNTYDAGDGGGGYAGEAGRLFRSHPNVYFIQGRKGGKGVGRFNTTTSVSGCPFYVAITGSDSQTLYGTPAASISQNSPYGGPSLNGSYISQESNGTNGAGGGSRYSKNGSNGVGGAGMAYLFY